MTLTNSKSRLFMRGFSIFLVLSVLMNPGFALAAPSIDKPTKGLLYPFYGENSECSSGGGGVSLGAGTNKDYAGRDILNETQLNTIKANQPIYEQAANEVGIPWHMLAVVHRRESSLGRNNLPNGQGIYQFVTKQGGPYPPGPVSDVEFLRQTKLAAAFLVEKAKSNYPNHRTLTKTSDAETLKDTFFSYNGRAGVYENQAQQLGFNPSTQGYEGSPYVMNVADEKRDPSKNKTTWGQVKRDFGPIEYPANGDYGAFVEYAALTGISPGGLCSGGLVNCTPGANTVGLSEVRQKVVCAAQQELAYWKSGQIKVGTGFHKYSQNRDENWCADFVSWLYIQAGYPVKDSNEGNENRVAGLKEIGQAGGKFQWHPAAGYTPRPGDMVIHDIGQSHVNVVVGVDGNKVTVIGGNQGGDGNQGSYFTTSSVTEYNMASPTSNGTSGYVSPD